MQVKFRGSVMEALSSPSPHIIKQLLLRGLFLPSVLMVVVLSSGSNTMNSCSNGDNRSCSSSRSSSRGSSGTVGNNDS